MSQQSQIVSVERLRGDSVLINLRDGTAIHLTRDQFLYLGVPRITILPDEDSFEQVNRRKSKALGYEARSPICQAHPCGDLCLTAWRCG